MAVITLQELKAPLKNRPLSEKNVYSKPLFFGAVPSKGLTADVFTLGIPHFSGTAGNALSYKDIASIPASEVLAPIEKRNGKKYEVVLVSDLFPNGKADIGSPQYIALVGQLMIFIAKVLDGIDDAAAQLPASQGFHQQGSRMMYWRFDDISSHVKQAIENPLKHQYWVVRDKDTQKIMGTTSVDLGSSRKPAQLEDVFLLPEMRRKREDGDIGLGKWLIAKAINRAAINDRKSIFLTTRAAGGFEAAVDLYERFGFKRVDPGSDRQRYETLVPKKFRSPRTLAMELALS
ncbi:MAG: GNAT family N-acetyltransferase [Cyanobacteria bacterium]|nr:GNAT family N-acetyltransferase [Cyanobacteriota bacterium]